MDLAKYKSIAVVGPNSNQTIYGDYAWTTRDTKEGVTLLQGLKDVLGNKVTVRHAEGCDWWSSKKDKIAEAVEAVRGSDLAIVAVGTRSTYLGRSPKYSTTGEGFRPLFAGTSRSTGGTVAGNQENRKTDGCRIDSRQTLAMPWVKENADALLVQWYGGEQQGRRWRISS